MESPCQFVVISFAAVFVCIGTAGCSLSSDAGCASDEECRFGRSCVDGACVGAVDLDRFDGSDAGNTDGGGDAGENDANNANDANNGEDTNNANNGENNANNGENNGAGSNCDSLHDCDGDALVCSTRDSDEPTCTEIDGCATVSAHRRGRECGWDLVCDANSLRFLFCEQSDQSTDCSCFLENGEATTFTIEEGNVCNYDSDRLADLVNIECGWAILSENF